ncbi:hypothetical protein ACWD4T_51420, partial [Streptomyces umbrinus]
APTPARTFSGVEQYTVAGFRPQVRCRPARGLRGAPMGGDRPEGVQTGRPMSARQTEEADARTPRI